MIANFARLRYTIYVWTKSNLTILEQGCQVQVQVWSAEKNSRNNKKKKIPKIVSRSPNRKSAYNLWHWNSHFSLIFLSVDLGFLRVDERVMLKLLLRMGFEGVP
jgi:hypothetical protein